MNRVKELCIKKGIEQKELSIMVGVSQPTVSDWFNNKKNPRGERLEKLCHILGVSRAYLLGFEEEKNFEIETTQPQDQFPVFHELAAQLTKEQRERVEEFMRFEISRGK